MYTRNLTLVFTIAIATYGNAQPILPENAKNFHLKAMTTIKPVYRDWVKNTAEKAGKEHLDSMAIHKLAVNFGNSRNFTNMDIMAMVVFVLTEVAKENESDLKQLAEEIKESNRQKKMFREALQELMSMSRGEITRAKLDSFRRLLNVPLPGSNVKLVPFVKSTKPNPGIVRDSTVQYRISQSGTASDTEIEEVIKAFQNRIEALADQDAAAKLSMQSLTDQYRKAVSTISNMMKKLNDTQQTIVQNLK